MKKYGSSILPLILIVLVAACAFVRLNSQGSLWAGSRVDLEMIMILLYVLWLFHEMEVSRPDLHNEKKSSDYGTREFYGIAHGLTILSALWFDTIWTRPGAGHYAGAVFFLAGIAFRT